MKKGDNMHRSSSELLRSRRPGVCVRPPTAKDLAEALSSAAAFREALKESQPSSRAHRPEEDRRQDRRLPLRLPVIFSGDGLVGFGVTRDVSLGGMFIETDTPAAFGERVTVKFRAAGLDESLSAPAVVRWVEAGKGMGVQLGSVRPIVIWALQQELKAFLQP